MSSSAIDLLPLMVSHVIGCPGRRPRPTPCEYVCVSALNMEVVCCVMPALFHDREVVIFCLAVVCVSVLSPCLVWCVYCVLSSWFVALSSASCLGIVSLCVLLLLLLSTSRIANAAVSVEYVLLP